MRHPWLKILAIPIVAFFLALIPFASANAWTPELRQSFRLEVFENPALGPEDYRFLATGILMANEGLSFEAASARIAPMILKDVKKLLEQDFLVTCFEIPKEKLIKLGAYKHEAISGFKATLEFERNGKTYVRWFVHPLHNPSFLEARFAKFKKVGLFRGLLTSSRSLVVKDLATQKEFSVKSSLKRAHGPFSDKTYPSDEAEFHFRVSEFLRSDRALNGRFLHDVAFSSLVAGEFNEGQSVRELSRYRKGEWIVSLSALLGTNLGRRVAHANGYGDDWVRFLAEKVMPELGETTALFYENHGFTHNSFHSQNITVRISPRSLQYNGTFVRDGDFNIDPEKFDLAHPGLEAFREGYRGRDLDLSILNSLNFHNFNDPGVSNSGFADNSRKMMYDSLSTPFFYSFLQKLKAMRNLVIDDERVFALARSRAYGKRENAGPGYRDAFTVSLSDIEKMLEPSDREPTLRPEKQNIANAQEAMSIVQGIVQGIVEGRSGPRAYPAERLQVGWNLLIEELDAKGKSSFLHAAIENADVKGLNAIHDFVEETQLDGEPFYSYLLQNFPRSFWASNAPEKIKERNYSPKLMRHFFSSAPSTVVDQYLESYNYYFRYRLFDQSQELFNLYLMRISHGKFVWLIRQMEYSPTIKKLNPSDWDLPNFLKRERRKIEAAIAKRIELKGQPDMCREAFTPQPRER